MTSSVIQNAAKDLNIEIAEDQMIQGQAPASIIQDGQMLDIVVSCYTPNDIVDMHGVTEDLKCLKLVMETLAYQLRNGRGQIGRLHGATEQRNKGYVFLAGGTFDLLIGLKENKVYDIPNKKHICMGNMNEKRFWNSVVYLNNTVYSLGGYSGSALGAAELYDPVSASGGVM
uniref:Uncharacterized protein n=1 Tax=Glossina pallidipes TaxID=7398 RepID=A0A1B0A3V4_GLOPL